MISRNIAEIKLNPRNPRVIKDDKFKKLVESLRTFPQMLDKRPLVCVTDPVDGLIFPLGGNMRLKAAKELKMAKMPVEMADDWTEEQRQEFIIKDNVGFGEWNYEELQAEWDVEQLEEWGLDMPDFSTDEILEDEQKDLSSNIENLYRIEVICKDEEHQETTYNKLIEQGYECRLLTL